MANLIGTLNQQGQLTATINYPVITLKGDTGETGNDGATPVKGVDYFTAEEIQDIASQVTAYDVRVTTQAEFDALIASPTWLDAVSVAFVGPTTFTKTNGIAIPSTVKQIVGVNNPVISITGYAYSGSNPYAFGYDSLPSTEEYFMTGMELKVRTTGTGTAYYAIGFKRIRNMYNCIADVNCNGTDTANGFSVGFDTCYNLYSCYSFTEMTNSFGFISAASGFKGCKNLTSCNSNTRSSAGTGTATSYGYDSCYSLYGCKATAWSSGNNSRSYGFYASSHVYSANSAATAILDAPASGTATGYGFNTCSYVMNPDPTATCTTSMFGGTNTDTNGDIDLMADGTVNKVFTASEKTKLAGIATNANNYVHPTTNGNKHIPADGAAGQVLVYDSSGTARWADSSEGSPGADGASAYEIAVLNGFVGSEADWLASLVGTPGMPGVDGYTPIKGIDYFDGEDGLPGAPGLPGQDGAPGQDGQDGTSFVVLGMYATLGELETAHPTGSAGNAWAVGTETANVIYTWDTDILDWVNLGSLQGPAGPQGLPGQDGIDGQDGLQGIPGLPGNDGYTPIKGVDYFDGADGAQGIPGYTPVKGVDYFDGAQGEQGIQGIPGTNGTNGTDGADGYTPVKGTDYFTAAEIADFIAEGLDKYSYTATLPSSSWTGASAPYTKEVTVTGIESTDIPVIDIVPTGTYATDVTMGTNWVKVYRAVTGTNTITFYAHEVPTADIPLIISGVK